MPGGGSIDGTGPGGRGPGGRSIIQPRMSIPQKLMHDEKNQRSQGITLPPSVAFGSSTEVVTGTRVPSTNDVDPDGCIVELGDGGVEVVDCPPGRVNTVGVVTPVGRVTTPSVVEMMVRPLVSVLKLSVEVRVVFSAGFDGDVALGDPVSLGTNVSPAPSELVRTVELVKPVGSVKVPTVFEVTVDASALVPLVGIVEDPVSLGTKVT